MHTKHNISTLQHYFPEMVDGFLADWKVVLVANWFIWSKRLLFFPGEEAALDGGV